MDMKKKLNKKGMGLGDLYQSVLIFVLIAVLIGVGLTLLSNLGQSSGISTDAETAINSSIAAVGEIPNTWMAIIVIVIVAAIVIGLLTKGFGMSGGADR